MTALNLFVRASSSYLLADTLGYSGDGVVVAKRSKIHAHAPLRLAIGKAGRGTHDDGELVQKWLEGQADQSAALRNIAQLLRELHDNSHGPAVDDDGHPEGVRICVAGYDLAIEQPFGFMMGSVANMLGDGYQAYTPIRARTLFSPPVRPDPWPGHTFDPDRDGLALAHRQRLAVDERGILRVGGHFEQWEVSRRGVSMKRICEWPDRVGSLIDPKSPVVMGTLANG